MSVITDMKKLLLEPNSSLESRESVSEPEVRAIEIIPPEECTESDVLRNGQSQDFPGSPVAKTSPSKVGDVVLIPG